MLRELRDDWRALTARAEAENAELNRMEGYARIVTGAAAAEGHDLPADLAAFAAEVRGRDAEIAERRRAGARLRAAGRPALPDAAAAAMGGGGARQAGRPRCPSTLNGAPTARRWRRPGAHCGTGGASPAGSRRRLGGSCAASASTTRSGSGKTRLPTRRWRARRGSRPATWRGRRRWPRARGPSAETVSRKTLRRTVAAWNAGPPAPEPARREVARDPRHEAAGPAHRDVPARLPRSHGPGPRGSTSAGMAPGRTRPFDGWLEKAGALRTRGAPDAGRGGGREARRSGPHPARRRGRRAGPGAGGRRRAVRRSASAPRGGVRGPPP